MKAFSSILANGEIPNPRWLFPNIPEIAWQEEIEKSGKSKEELFREITSYVESRIAPGEMPIVVFRHMAGIPERNEITFTLTGQIFYFAHIVVFSILTVPIDGFCSFDSLEDLLETNWNKFQNWNEFQRTSNPAIAR